jgi:hypothetical protein
VYQKCLGQLGIYEDLPRLSRKIDQYLRSVSLRKRGLKGIAVLSLPQLPQREDSEALKDWATQFERNNAEWFSDKEKLRDKAERLVKDSWRELQGIRESPNGERKLLRRLRFGVNKLIELGVGGLGSLLAEILCKDSWLVSDPSALAKRLRFRVGLATLIRFSLSP